MPQRETIWIIGASDGIGAALARHWAGRSAKLILSARSGDKLQALAQEIGQEALAMPLDVGSREDIEKVARQIREIGPLDRVIHLAAIYDPGRIDAVEPGLAADIINVNVAGSFHIAQVAPDLMRPGGQLALCGSVAGYFGLPQGQIYSATKAAVMNLAESLRAELSGKIDVRLISPGFVDTRLTQRNAFTMPGLMTPEAAATRIAHGLNSNRFEIHFPRRLTWALKLLRVLPYRLAFFLTRQLVQDPKAPLATKVEHP